MALWEASHTTPRKQLVFFFFCEVMPFFYQSNRYFCCSVWTSRTSHTHLLYRLNKCRDNQRERGVGRRGAPWWKRRHWSRLRTPRTSLVSIHTALHWAQSLIHTLIYTDISLGRVLLKGTKTPGFLRSTTWVTHVYSSRYSLILSHSL